MAVVVGLPEQNATQRTIFRIHGINTLANPTMQFSLPINAAEIAFTEIPEPYFDHIDRQIAVGRYLFGKRVPSDQEGDHINELVADIASSRKITAGVYLIVDTVAHLAEDEHGAWCNFGNLACRLSSGPPASNSEHLEIASSFLVSIQMSLSIQFDVRLERLGSSIFYQQKDGLYCYGLRLSGGSMEIHLAQPVKGEHFDSAQQYNKAILNEPKHRNVSTLLVQSQFHRSEPTQSFILAWAALELLVKSNTPRRIKNLTEKFILFTNRVGGTDQDVKTFIEMNRARNSLFHEGVGPKALPTDDIYRLSIKYLKLLMECSSKVTVRC